MFVHCENSVCPFVRLSDHVLTISNSVKYFLIGKYNCRPWSPSLAEADVKGD